MKLDLLYVEPRLVALYDHDHPTQRRYRFLSPACRQAERAHHSRFGLWDGNGVRVGNNIVFLNEWWIVSC